ncbi:Uncharacterized protein Fot_06676 [Forsythia ovata]|uniref:Uncharacterized protein n=1 Tax=Forsythia ovata TaxID=205694 RepID=A0ABD1WTN5_9LAMI
MEIELVGGGDDEEMKTDLKEEMTMKVKKILIKRLRILKNTYTYKNVKLQMKWMMKFFNKMLTYQLNKRSLQKQNQNVSNVEEEVQQSNELELELEQKPEVDDDQLIEEEVESIMSSFKALLDQENTEHFEEDGGTIQQEEVEENPPNNSSSSVNSWLCSTTSRSEFPFLTLNDGSCGQLEEKASLCLGQGKGFYLQRVGSQICVFFLRESTQRDILHNYVV